MYINEIVISHKERLHSFKNFKIAQRVLRNLKGGKDK